MATRDALIGTLADGHAHSGTALATRLGVTRSAVWKQVRQLGDLGLEVEVTRSRGYRLTRPLQLLDGRQIFTALEERVRAACESIEILGVTDSTSARLQAGPAPAVGRWRCVLAEFQTAGRGRRGNRWFSPYGSGLCLSLAWSFTAAPRELPALSLAVGIAVRRVAVEFGARGARLKWPNDVVAAGAKLAGILIDIDGEAGGPLRAVIGVGLNVAVTSALRRAVTAAGGMPPAGLHREGADPCARNALAAALIGALVGILEGFADTGFAPLADEWRRHDELFGREIVVRTTAGTTTGVARGIAPDGALLLESGTGLAAVFAGDVSVRADS